MFSNMVFRSYLLDLFRIGALVLIVLLWPNLVSAQEQNKGGIDFQVEVKTGSGSPVNSGGEAAKVPSTPPQPGQPPVEQNQPFADIPPVQAPGPEVPVATNEGDLPVTLPMETEKNDEPQQEEVPVDPAKQEFNNALGSWYDEMLSSYVLNVNSMSDPFMPIESVAKPPEPEQNKEVESLPLIQRLNLNQFTLSAIIVSDNPDNTTALVDSGGVGYLIRKGTKIGPNKGVVKEITDTRVIIEEPERSGYGKPGSSRISEFKLFSPENTEEEFKVE